MNSKSTASSHLYNLSLLLSHFYKLPLFCVRFLLSVFISCSLGSTAVAATLTQTEGLQRNSQHVLADCMIKRKRKYSILKKIYFMYISGPQDKKIFYIFVFKLMVIRTTVQYSTYSMCLFGFYSIRNVNSHVIMPVIFDSYRQQLPKDHPVFSFSFCFFPVENIDSHRGSEFWANCWVK